MSYPNGIVRPHTHTHTHSLIILGEQYKLWSSSLWSLLHSPFSSLVGTDIRPRILLSGGWLSNIYEKYISAPLPPDSGVSKLCGQKGSLRSFSLQLYTLACYQAVSWYVNSVILYNYQRYNCHTRRCRGREGTCSRSGFIPLCDSVLMF